MNQAWLSFQGHTDGGRSDNLSFEFAAHGAEKLGCRINDKDVYGTSDLPCASRLSELSGTAIKLSAFIDGGGKRFKINADCPGKRLEI